MYVSSIANGSQILSHQGLLKGQNWPKRGQFLSQNITLFFLAHLIISGKEEFSGFIEDYVLWWKTTLPSLSVSLSWRLKGDCKKGCWDAVPQWGGLLGSGLADVPLCLPEQGIREVERGVTVEQLASMHEFLWVQWTLL